MKFLFVSLFNIKREFWLRLKSFSLRSSTKMKLSKCLEWNCDGIKLALPKIKLILVFRSKKRKGEKNADENEDFADVIRQKSILRRHFFADVKKSEFQRLSLADIQ